MTVWLLLLALAAEPSPPPGDASPSRAGTRPPPTSAPRVAARASKTDVTVGEAFFVEVAATGPAGTAWTFPDDPGTEQVELRTAANPQNVPLPTGFHRYQAGVFAVGDVAIPRIPVKYRLPDGTEGETTTEPVPLRIVSLLPKGEAEPQLVDIRGPRGVSIGRAFWLALAAGAALAALVIALVLKRRRRAPVAAPAAPPVPPDVEALRALDALAASALLDHGEVRRFYIELIAVAKRYLERRLGAPVLEMTSHEATLFLKGHPQAAPLATAFREMCGAADQVKFARGDTVADEVVRHLTAARSLVSTLESRLQAAEAKAAEAARARPEAGARATGRVA